MPPLLQPSLCKPVGEDRASRMLRKANMIRMALGGEAGTAAFIARKPKGMWNRTYQAKVDRICRAEYQADLAFLSRYGDKLDFDDLRAVSN